MKRSIPSTRHKLCVALALTSVILGACSQVDAAAAPQLIDTGADTDLWVAIPAGPFVEGQHEATSSIDYDYAMMAYLVTVEQYAAYVNEALAAGAVKVVDEELIGYYPGDEFRGAKHEERIGAGDYLQIPLKDPALRMQYDGHAFTVVTGWAMHPITMVTWFGAKAYCDHYGWRLPAELEWEKAARGPLDGPESNRPFPWGADIAPNNANYYASRDPFEKMASFGSRTTPVGFYNGRTYDGYVTVDSPSPYGLYDMAGNVWQWTGDVHPFEHYRYLRGGSKDTYDMDLRVWVRNSATPTYFSPGVGFRCAR